MSTFGGQHEADDAEVVELLPPLGLLPRDLVPDERQVVGRDEQLLRAVEVFLAGGAVHGDVLALTCPDHPTTQQRTVAAARCVLGVRS